MRRLLAVGLVGLVAAAGCIILLITPHNSSADDAVSLIEPIAVWRRSVIVMRHCARACKTEFNDLAPGFSHLSDYAAQPFPAWPVPAMSCLPKGTELIKAAGRHLVKVVHQPVVVIADGMERDIESAQAVLEGLGMPDVTGVSIDAQHQIFHPYRAGVCGGATGGLLDQILLERIEGGHCPVTNEYVEAMRELQTIIGQGVAPPLESIPDIVRNGDFGGRSKAGLEIVETILMQMAGGLEFAWGKMIPSTVRRLFTRVSRHYACVARQNKNVVRGMSNLVAHMLSYLEGGEADGTLMLVGHDTQISGLQAMFDLIWYPHPFEKGVAIPGGMLRFEVARMSTGDLIISVHFDYSTLGPHSEGNLYSAPVYFADGRTTIRYDEFRRLALSRIDSSCSTINLQTV